MTTKTP